jgi:hypothetical protein
MKFLIFVLITRFVIELVSNKKDKPHVSEADVMNEKIRHPAEFNLR